MRNTKDWLNVYHDFLSKVKKIYRHQKMTARFLKDEVTAMAGYKRLSRGEKKRFLNVLAKAKHPCQHIAKREICRIAGCTNGQFLHPIPTLKTHEVIRWV